MEIKFVKDITKSGQDGFGLLYEVQGKPFEIQISDTALSTFHFPMGKPHTANELLDNTSFELLISQIVGDVEDGDIKSYKVILSSEGAGLNGKIIFSRDVLKKYIKFKWTD